MEMIAAARDALLSLPYWVIGAALFLALLLVAVIRKDSRAWLKARGRWVAKTARRVLERSRWVAGKFRWVLAIGRWAAKTGKEYPVWVALGLAFLTSAILLYFNVYKFNKLFDLGSPNAPILAGLAAYLAYRRTEELARQNEVALRGQDNKSYVSAVEQLGGRDMLIRAAGLYGLERLVENAKDNGERQQIVKLIASFARTRARLKMEEESEGKGTGERKSGDYRPQKEERDLTNAEEAIKILARVAQEEDRDGKLINLSNMTLLHADLDEADLAGFNFRRSAFRNLRGTYLSEADLSGADLSGASLFHVHLSFANLSFANLSKASLFGMHLSKANLYGADLANATLLRANLADANLSDANLSEARLLGSNFSRADFSISNLSKADFSDTNMAEAKNLEQWQIDEMIYGRGTPPINFPKGLDLKEGDRVEEKRRGRTFLILPEEKREKRK